MIPLLPLLALQQPHFIPPPNSQEPLVALAFLREASIGLVPGEVADTFELHGTPHVEAPDWTHPESRVYLFLFGTVGISTTTGRITFYTGGGGGQPAYDREGRFVPRAVSDQAAKAIARRIYHAAGFPGEIACDVRDADGSGGGEIGIYYTPVVGGVPYEGLEGGAIHIDRQTGLLTSFGGSPRRSAPPASLVPALSLDAARALALRTGADRQGEALAEEAVHPFRLVVWAPDPDQAAEVRAHARRVEPDRYEEAPVAAEARRAGRGLLAYAGWVRGGTGGSVEVVVDAGTGALLSSDQWALGGVGPASRGGRAPSAPARPPLLPATAPRPWRVAVGDGPLVGPVDAALSPAGAASTAGIRVDLTDGRAAFPARYDPATGLLGISGKAYRPGPALADLLRRRARG